jgi:hypothetical protein
MVLEFFVTPEFLIQRFFSTKIHYISSYSTTQILLMLFVVQTSRFSILGVVFQKDIFQVALVVLNYCSLVPYFI